jgi:hypothetical protein
MLALTKKADDSHIILVEEPENHLSFSSLNMIMDRISLGTQCSRAQGRTPPGPLRWSSPSHFDASQGARLDRPAGHAQVARLRGPCRATPGICALW